MTPTKQFSTWRVLIIDDEPDNLMLAAITLEFHGAEICTAPDGQTGMDQAVAFDPTLILLDLSMPGLDGWDVFTLLRARSEFDKIPIVALTANAMPDDAAKVRAMGFDGYITKPFRVTEFLEAVKECVARFEQSKLSAVEKSSDPVKPLNPVEPLNLIKPPAPAQPLDSVKPLEPIKPLETVTGENHA